ncbi:MAG: glycosyltransferase, partial [Verrucomicrobia bacterium]|nr:glycosyltransferase [Verrucomicrobiota bacterium]
LAMLTGAFFLFMTRRWPWALLALAGAVHVKYVAIALVPFFIHRRTLKWSWLLPVGILLPFVFFLPGQGLFASFRTFTTTMHFNGSIHAILSCILSDYAAASVVCALAFSALILCLRMGTGSPFQNAGHVMGGLLLLSPTVHFWYLTWFIPFIVIKPTRAWILFCATIAFSFTAQAHMVAHSSWKEITWATYAVYVPVYAMLFVDLFLRRKTGSFDDGACRLPPRTVSVVVPTLNERGNLPSLFESIRNQTVVPIDIIVADGGSTDGTVEFVRSQGAVVLQTERSRGAQIRAATERAEGEMIFIAHADMTLAPDVLDRALKSFPGTCIPGGCVGARFSGHSVLLRILSSINELRARCLGISYGAQGQYVRRDWLMGEGGFPDIPLMEDVELSLRFKRKGRPFYLRGGVTASARRWAEEKRLLHLLLVAALTTWYVVLRAFKENVDTQRFYQRYYR